MRMEHTELFVFFFYLISIFPNFPSSRASTADVGESDLKENDLVPWNTHVILHVHTTVLNKRGVMVKALEFELQSRYYVHFQTNTFGKVKPSDLLVYELNSTTTVLPKKMMGLALTNPRRLICY